MAAPKKPANNPLKVSHSMEEVDDNEHLDYIHNVAPRNKLRTLERSDGSDDDDGEVEVVGDAFPL